MINSIGENIRKIRIEKELTQKELAKKSGVSLSALNKYEREDRIPKIDAIEKLSDALNIQIDYLLGNSEFKKIGSQIMLDDIKHLIEKTDNSNEEFSKLVTNIVDTMFLTICSFVDSENIEALNIIHDLYRNIFTMKIIRNNKKTYDILMPENFDESMHEKLSKMDEQYNDETSTIKSIEDMLKYSERNLPAEAFKTILQDNSGILSKQIDKVSNEEFEELRKNIADYIKYQLSKLDDK